MKKFTFIISLVMMSIQTNGQIVTPSVSPLMTFTQKVGITKIELSYSRPSVNSRNIFSKDGLVPFDEFWRTGANSPTLLTISEAIEFNGQSLEKGSYVLITKPGASTWDIHLYTKEKGGWNTYLDRVPVLTTSIKAQKTSNQIESLLIYLDDIKTTSTNLLIHWDDTAIEIPIKVEVHDKVMASIDKTMAGPSDFEYFRAASYLSSSDTDLDRALKYIQIATNGTNPQFFFYRIEAIILAKLGRYEEAIESAKRSNELAEKVNNIDAIKINNASIEAWMKK